MKRYAGFTLIELLITITIMVILLSLSVVALQSTQVSARDEERRTDVDIIARHLEIFYDTGAYAANLPQVMPTTSVTLASTSIPTGRLAVDGGVTGLRDRYPSTEIMDTEAEVRATLGDIDLDALRAPNVAATEPISLIVATSTGAQTPTESQYIYQPLDRNDALCISETTECPKYTLYYRLESDNTVQQITGKHQ